MVSIAKSLPMGAESEVREKGGVPWNSADETVCDCWVVWGHVCDQMIPKIVSPGGERVGGEEMEMSITKKPQASQRHQMRSTDDGRDMAP